MSPDKSLFNLPYVEHALSNGLKVVAVRVGAPDVVSLQIPVHVGSRNEVEPGRSGFAHFFEHMMFRGTPTNPPQRYQALLTRAGADQNAYTSDDFTNFHTTFTAPDLDRMLALEADRFQHLHLEEQGFRTEALAVKGEYLKNVSDPLEKMEEVLRDAAFTTHPYQHTTMGFFADIETMPNQLAYARVFFSRWYRPGNTTIVLTGDIDPERAIERVAHHWSDWQPGDFRAKVPPEPAPSGPLYRHIQWQSPTQPWVMVAFRGPRFSTTDKAMACMSFIDELYFSTHSVLYEQLVVERQQADELFTDFSNHEDPYLLVVAVRLTDESHARAVTRAILETLSRAASERVASGELAGVCRRLRSIFSQSLSDAESVGDLLVEFMRFERSAAVVNRQVALWQSLTPEDVRAAAARYFVPVGRTIVSLSNQTDIGLASMVEKAVMPAAPLSSPPALATVLRPCAAPVVDFRLTFNAGACKDPPDKRGLAMLTAMMVADGGTTQRSRTAIQQALYPLAAQIDVCVDKEMVTFSGRVRAADMAAYYAVVRERLLMPSWHARDLERLRTRLINSIRTDLRADNDEELGKAVLFAEVFGPNHPYGYLSLGTVAGLQSITADDCRAFCQRYLTATNATLALGGAYPEALPNQVQRDLAVLGAVAPPIEPLPGARVLQRREAVIVSKQTPAVAVSFGQPIDVVRGDADWVALWLARAWLGEHRSSVGRLYQRIRELRGMNYGNYAYIEAFPDGMFATQPAPNRVRRQSLFEVWLRPLRNNADAVFAIRLALHELASLVDNGLSAAEFIGMRDYLHKFVALLVQSSDQSLGYAVDSAYYGMPDFVTYVRDGLASLTVADVNTAVRRHLDTERMQFVLVAEHAAELRDRLVNDTPSNVTYNVAMPAEVIAEDNVVDAQPLGFDADAVRTVSAHTLFER